MSADQDFSKATFIAAIKQVGGTLDRIYAEVGRMGKRDIDMSEANQDKATKQSDKAYKALCAVLEILEATKMDHDKPVVYREDVTDEA